MLDMENAEEIMQILERFTRLKQKEIPKELDDYMHYVAKSGDTVFKWASLKYLFREKLLSVIKNFHDTTPRVDDLPQYPNVDPFNYESMKSSLIERLELFNAAPFTIQRLCELLTEPRKQYSRIDKFMRALEKNILVVSTIEPGRKHSESENGDSLDSVVNGDISLDVNVDIDMETEPIFNTDSQSNTASSVTASNPTHKLDDDILPNPKKPKLDISNINDEVSKIDVNTKTTVRTGSEEPQKENAIVEELTIITDRNCEKICDKNTVSDNKKDIYANEDDSIKNIEKERDDINSESEINITKEKTKKLNKENENSTPSAEISKTITPLSEHTLAETKNVDVDKTYKEVESKNDAKKEAADVGGKTDLTDNQDGDPKSNNEENENTITKNTSSKTNDNSINILTEQTVPQPEKIINVKGAEIGQSLVDKQLAKNSDLSSSEDISVTVLNVKAEQGSELGNFVEASTVISTEQLNLVDAETSIEPAGKTDAAAEMSPITESVQDEYNEFPTKVQPIEEKIKEDLLATKVVQNKDIASLNSVGQSVNTDQPMDDNTDLISEIDPVVDNTANVDEIVMTDSVDMTTETIELCKEEPAGMEIDDTSQEAMDQ